MIRRLILLLMFQKIVFEAGQEVLERASGLLSVRKVMYLSLCHNSFGKNGLSSPVTRNQMIDRLNTWPRLAQYSTKAYATLVLAEAADLV